MMKVKDYSFSNESRMRVACDHVLVQKTSNADELYREKRERDSSLMKKKSRSDLRGSFEVSR